MIYKNALIACLLALSLNLCRANDSEGDNLSDAWKTEFGLSLSAYDTAHLVGWWQLNGTSNSSPATDRTTNAINGTLNNFPASPAAYQTGLFDNGLNFASNSTVTFPTNSQLNVNSGFTYSVWFQAPTGTTATTITTWSDGTNGWSLGVGTNGAANITFLQGATNQIVTQATGFTNLYDGQWHSIVATFNGTTGTIYVDGTSEATSTITSWTPSAIASFTFGSATNTPFALDEVRLYNRAMTATEIPQLPATYSDLNGTGLTEYEDYLENLNPVASGIITPGFISSGMTTFYTGTPSLTKTSGDGQLVSGSTLATTALTVLLKDGTGAPLAGAPVTFTCTSGGISLTSGGTTTTSLSMTADGSGNATVYYEAGTEAVKNNTVTATAVTPTTSISTNFKEYCGIQNGLSLWMKTSAGLSTSGAAITSWTDQTINGLSATQTTTLHQPQLGTDATTGLPTATFNGSQYLTNTTSSNTGNNGDLTIICVSAATNINNETTSVGIGIGGYTASRYIGYYQSDFYFNYEGSPTYYALGGIAPIAGTSAVTTTTLKSSTKVVSFYAAGTLDGTWTLNLTPAAVTNGFTIGANNTQVKPWVGTISEVLIFNRVITSTEQNAIEGQLADEYGLYNPNATWPSSYTSDVQSEITRNHWNQNQANAYVTFVNSNPAVPPLGLILWMKADAGLTLSGTNITSWQDQSPWGHIATQATTLKQPTLVTEFDTGEPAVRFNSAQSQYLSNSNDTITSIPDGDITIISVAENEVATNYGFVGGLSTTGNGNGRAFGYQSGVASFATGVASGYIASGTAGPGTGRATLATAAFTQSTHAVSFYQSGTSNGSTTANLHNYALGNGFVLGSGWLANYWLGDLSEYLVYNRLLSLYEQQQAESYLAGHYHLAYTIPLPTISPNGGSFTSPTTITFSSFPPSVALKYTLDGSQPTSTSTSYGGYLVLSGSAPVTWAIFQNGLQVSTTGTAQFYIGDTGHIGITDAWQTLYFGHTGIDPNADPTHSGLTNLQKYLYGYDPTKYSSNGDGLSDAINYSLGYAATNTDINGYGLTNAQQLTLGLDPFDVGINPPLPTPVPGDTTPPTITLLIPHL